VVEVDEEQESVIPNLFGRIQTRIFLVVVIGGLWTLIITPLLGVPAFTTLSERYVQTYYGLFLVLVLGIGWELVYHFLMQFRWEKDWPTLFGLLTGINESILVWIVVLNSSVGDPDAALSWVEFGVYFWTTWIAIWLFANGPMKVLFIHWRFRGGRIV
jgi:hypothetical protein